MACGDEDQMVGVGAQAGILGTHDAAGRSDHDARARENLPGDGQLLAWGDYRIRGGLILSS